ncbi:hypothetical protein QTP88_008872 [Uroleucon formosanum]
MVKEKKMAYAMRTISDEINTSHTLHLDHRTRQISGPRKSNRRRWPSPVLDIFSVAHIAIAIDSLELTDDIFCSCSRLQCSDHWFVSTVPIIVFDVGVFLAMYRFLTFTSPRDAPTFDKTVSNTCVIFAL